MHRGAYNTAQVGMQGNINQANAAIAEGNNKKDGGIFGGIGSLLGGMAEGGMVPKYAEGGDVGLGMAAMPGAPMQAPMQQTLMSQPNQGSYAANYLLGQDSAPLSNVANETVGVGKLTPTADNWFSANSGSMPGKVGGIMSKVGKIAALFEAGGNVNPLNGEAYAQAGMTVPGQASIPGNSLKNDTVPAMLSPGEIIVPRDHAMDPEKAASFAYAVAMRNRKGNK
jgi:hypothetical protein